MTAGNNFWGQRLKNLSNDRENLQTNDQKKIQTNDLSGKQPGPFLGNTDTAQQYS